MTIIINRLSSAEIIIAPPLSKKAFLSRKELEILGQNNNKEMTKMMIKSFLFACLRVSFGLNFR